MSKATITFRDKYENRKGESPLFIVICVKGIKVRLATGVSVKRDQWDPIKQLITGKGKNIEDLNLILSDCLAKVNNILVKYRLQNKILSAEQMRFEYAHYSASIDFNEFMQLEINRRKVNGEIEGSTLRQHEVCLNKLKEFRPKLTFSEIDEDFVHQFKSWLKTKKKNDINTISSNLKNFKTYINRAIKKKIINENPFRFVPLIQSKNDRVFLTDTEIVKLIKLYDKNYLPPSYQKVLRHFLFAVTTGLRISDVKAITMNNIVKDTLVFVPYKTRNKKADVVRIPLQSLSLRMIRDESPHRLKGPVFTMLSEFRTNEYLKEIVKVVKIEKHISFHIARHTFATYFLRKTKNLLALQKLLGHSDLRETMIYSHILMEDIEKEMVCFEDLLK